MDTTDRDPVPTIMPHLQAMSSDIVHREGRLSMDLPALLSQLPGLEGTAKIKLYRLSERDVSRGQAALTEMTVEEIVSVGNSITNLIVTGRYRSSDREAPETTFEKVMCVISKLGDIQIFLQSNGHWLIVKRADDPALIFIDLPKEKSHFHGIGTVVDFVRATIDRLRRR